MKSLKIAICDDDKLQTSIIEKLVEEIAAKKFVKVDVSVFYDGITFNDYYKRNNYFDIIYLDIEMNKMNGIKTAQYIREINPEVIIIFISGYENYFYNYLKLNHLGLLKNLLILKSLTKYFVKHMIGLCSSQLILLINIKS